MNDKIKLPVILGFVAGISALLIGVVNHITKPIIEDSLIKKQEQIYSEIFEDFDSAETSENDDKYTKILNSSGEMVGTVCKVSGLNSYGNISALVGFDTELSIVGIKYLKFAQTPGFGDKVQNDSYLNQYVGDSYEEITADAVSGATYSSKLVRELVDSCSEDLNDEGLTEKDGAENEG